MKELVSIISPSYNGSEYIAETIESVLNQIYTNWEMIIIDDCSSDNTELIVSNYQKLDSRIKFFKNDVNLGPAKSRNKAIKLAKGRFIAFLDTDDLWKSNKLSEQINFMQENKIVFCSSFFNQIDEQSNFISKNTNIPYKISYNDLLLSNKVACLTAVYDTDYFGKIYMDNIAKRQDYGLWLKLLKKTDYVYCYPKILADYRIRKNSLSSNKLDLVKYHWFLYYKYEKLGFSKSLFLTFSYILKTLKTKYQ